METRIHGRVKKLLGCLACVLVLAAALALGICAATSAKAATLSGTCGKNGGNLTWTLTDGVLTIEGSGEMADYDYLDEAPWYEARDTITEIIIKDGVTSIGNRWKKSASTLP